MDPIKEAFSKIKADVESLRLELSLLREELSLVNSSLQTLESDRQTIDPGQTDQQTVRQSFVRKNNPLESLYSPNSSVSKGNGGVPTDRPTNYQTDQQTVNSSVQDPISDFRKANEILSTLDEVKKNIRSTFKGLTAQEMKVFSTIYELEDGGHEQVTYKLVSSVLGLSESSIRDYVNKIVQKGVQIDKIRLNNKLVCLSIPTTIRDITSLPTIQQLYSL